MVRYDIPDARLLLEHAHHQGPGPARVYVDVNLILESTKPATLQNGCWVNVIGYTQGTPIHGRAKRGLANQATPAVACVQAILIWDAGAISLSDYENTLEEQRRVQQHNHVDRS